jgi:hypothetical protein
MPVPAAGEENPPAPGIWRKSLQSGMILDLHEINRFVGTE